MYSHDGVHNNIQCVIFKLYLLGSLQRAAAGETDRAITQALFGEKFCITSSSTACQ